MNKKEFIKTMDKTAPIFNEINIWGIIFDYMEHCTGCNIVLITPKNKYMSGQYYYDDKPFCVNCISTQIKNRQHLGR